MGPHYLDVDGAPVYAVQHMPGAARSTAVLFIPPLGFEDTASYRTRRAWANALADDGFAVWRFDLPGTGDSAGAPQDSGQLDRWRRAVSVAAASLRASTGATQVAAIGIGFGGLLALVSASGAGLDDLVLWGTRARGRAVVRELRAFASLESSRAGDDGPLSSGDFTVNGFLVTAETASAIGALDGRAVPAGSVRRALLLERDGLAVDDGLREALVESGADVRVEEGPGYGEMMSEPQLSVPPRRVMATVSSWLAEGASSTTGAMPAPVLVTDARVDVDGAVVRERLVTFETPVASLAGVVTDAPDVPDRGDRGDLTAVLLNAGATRRAGPNRMWVEAARRWAARGVPTVRLDLAALGDSGGDDRFPFETDELYRDAYGGQVASVLDRLVADGYPRRFVLMGLCSGAYWSFQTAQADDRVVGVILLNPLALVFDPFAGTLRESREARQLLRWQKWVSIARGEVSRRNAASVAGALARRASTAPGRAARRMVERRQARVAGGDALDLQLDRLRENGVRGYVIFSPDEPLYVEQAGEDRWSRLDRWPNLRLHLLEGPPDTHTLQTIELQQQVHALADAAIDELSGHPARSPA